MAEEPDPAADLTVRKIGYRVPVMLDTDGTPLWLGERMVEVMPGEWMTPLGAELVQLVAEQARALDERLIR